MIDKINFSTTYVPLQPPYQIIKYGGDIAMQIGTLIVTTPKSGKEYEIETHSHPVVMYGDKNNPELANRQLTNHYYLEGAVWNHVEVRDVTTLCLSGAKLEWREFLEILEIECIRECMYRAAPQIGIYWELKKLGVKILPPEERECTINLCIYPQPEEAGLSLQAQRGDLLFLNVSVAEDDDQNGIENVFYIEKTQTWDSHKWKDDEQVDIELSSQLQHYRYVLRDLLYNEEVNHFTVTYKTSVKRFQKMVNELNGISDFVNLSYLS